MVEFTLSAGGSIPCWPFFYYNSSNRSNFRRVQCCWPLCLYKHKEDKTEYSCAYCLFAYKRSQILLNFWFLFFFIYKSTLDTLYWTICLLIIYRRREDNSKKIRFLGVFVVNFPAGGFGDAGFYLNLFYIFKFHRKQDGYRLWCLLLFIRVQPHRKTYTLFPFFSFRWRDNVFVEYQFLLYMSQEDLSPNSINKWSAIFPLYYFHSYDGEDYYNWLLFGIIRWSKDGNIYRKRFILYSHKRSENRFKWSFLVLMKYKSKAENWKFRIYPIFGMRRKPFHKNIWLLPIFFFEVEDEETYIWILLFFRHSGDNQSTTIIFPFFFKHYSDNSRLLFFWIWYHRYKERSHVDKSYTLPIPIYYRSHNLRYNRKWIFPFYFWLENHTTHTRTTAYFPLVTSRYKNDILRRRFYCFALYAYHCPVEGDEAYLSTGYDILWPFIHVDRHPGDEYHEYRVLPFFWEKKSDATSLWRAIFPIYFYRESGNQVTRIILLGGFHDRYDNHEEWYFAPLWILPPYIWSSYLSDRHYSRGFWPLFSTKRRDNTLRTSHFYPLYRRKERPNYVNTRIMLLYQNKINGENYRKQKVLFGYYRKKNRRKDARTCCWFGCFSPWISCLRHTVNLQDNPSIAKRIYVAILFTYSETRTGFRFGLFWLFQDWFSLFFIKKTGEALLFRIMFLIYVRYNDAGRLVDLRILWIDSVGLFVYSVTDARKQYYLLIIFNYIDRGDNQNTSVFWLFYHNFALIHSNSMKRRFWIFPFYYTREIQDGVFEWSFLGYRRVALGYFNDRERLWYILPLAIKYQPTENGPVCWSFLGLGKTFSFIRYEPDRFVRFFPIFWKTLQANPNNDLFALIYLFTPKVALLSSSVNRTYVFLLMHHYTPQSGNDADSWSFLWFGDRHVALLFISSKRVFIAIIFYLFRDAKCTRYSILWLFSGKISIIHYYAEGTSRIFPLCSANAKKSDTTTVKLLFGFVHCKIMDSYVNFRILYRLFRFKIVDGSLIRFELNPILFCNYKNPARETCLACGGCMGNTYKGLRCCWCVNMKL